MTTLRKTLRRIVHLDAAAQACGLPRALVVTLTPQGLVRVKAFRKRADRSEATLDLVKFFGTVGMGQLFLVSRPKPVNEAPKVV